MNNPDNNRRPVGRIICRDNFATDDAYREEVASFLEEYLSKFHYTKDKDKLLFFREKHLGGKEEGIPTYAVIRVGWREFLTKIILTNCFRIEIPSKDRLLMAYEVINSINATTVYPKVFLHKEEEGRYQVRAVHAPDVSDYCCESTVMDSISRFSGELFLSLNRLKLLARTDIELEADELELLLADEDF